MNAGKNVWLCSSCGHEWKNEERPADCPVCKMYTVDPKVNLERVHGHTFQYYHGDSEWEGCANDVLKSNANNNFRTSR